MSEPRAEYTTPGDTNKPTPEAPTLAEIAEALDSLADAVVKYDLMEYLDYNASFWRDAAEVLRRQSE